MTRVRFRSCGFVVALMLLVVACGAADEDTDLTSASSDADVAPTATVTDEPVDDDFSPGMVDEHPEIDAELNPDEPIPVEPDGGIGDGAGPIPGTEDDAPASTGDWHGAELAETNCPGTDFQRVEAAAFSFSVPTDFVDQNAQGIDSEIGIWSRTGGAGNGIEVLFDYGWYSSPVADFVGAEVSSVDYSGFSGDFAVVREPAGSDRRSVVGVYFPDVETDGFQGNALSMIVQHDDPADEIIGRCIVGSIEWKVSR